MIDAWEATQGVYSHDVKQGHACAVPATHAAICPASNMTALADKSGERICDVVAC